LKEPYKNNRSGLISLVVYVSHRNISNDQTDLFVFFCTPILCAPVHGEAAGGGNRRGGGLRGMRVITGLLSRALSLPGLDLPHILWHYL